MLWVFRIAFMIGCGLWAWAGAYLLLLPNSVSWLWNSGFVTIRYRVWPFTREVRVNCSDTGVELSEAENVDFASSVQLLLVRKSSPPLMIAKASALKELQPAFQALSKAFEGPARQEVELQSVAEVLVPIRPLDRMSDAFRKYLRRQRLREMPDGCLAVTEQRFGLAVIWFQGVLAIWGLASAAAGIWFWSLRGGASVVIVLILVFAVCCFCLAFLLLPKSGWHIRWLFDPRRRMILYAEPPSRDRPKERFRFPDVAAVQVCPRELGVFGEVPTPGTGYEINLVIRGSKAVRIGILRDTNESRAKRNAKQLAEFLSLPLVDSTVMPSQN